MTVEMTYESIATITTTNTDPDGYVTSLSCPITLEDPDGTSLVTFAGNDMTVTTWSGLLVGTNTRTVRATMRGPGLNESDGHTPKTRDETVVIEVTPNCQ